MNAPRHEILISNEQIQQRIHQLGSEISKEYQGKTPIFIGILNGSFIFLADLIRKITIDCEVDFIKLSSYRDSQISSGKVTMLKDFDCQIEGRDIIVVEDIVDSGLSLQYLRRKLTAMKPKSLAFVSLLLKPATVKIDFKIDYVGFSIPDQFVVGYGLDHAHKYRNLPGVFVIH